MTMIFERIGYFKIRTDKYTRNISDLKPAEAELVVPFSKLKAPFPFTLRISATLGMKCIFIIVINVIINHEYSSKARPEIQSHLLCDERKIHIDNVAKKTTFIMNGKIHPILSSSPILPPTL